MSTKNTEYLTACEHCGKIFLEDNPRKVHESTCADKGLDVDSEGDDGS